MNASQPPVLRVEDLIVDYRIGRQTTRAVDDVSFTIAPGQTLGLVGESGSGKTTIGRAVLGLAPVTSGRVHFEGELVSALSQRRRRSLGGKLQVIFQNPYGSLDPTKTIGYTLAEPVLLHERVTREVARARAVEMLERVGLPSSSASRYPAQFSGGQRQRIAIARALMLSPSLVICDEPVSALDVSVQAGVVNLMGELQRDLGVGYPFISHDLTVVRHICDPLVVLEKGRIVEYGDAEQIYQAPRHPYTRTLLAAAPVPDPQVQRARRQDRRGRSSDPDVTEAPHTVSPLRPSTMKG